MTSPSAAIDAIFNRPRQAAAVLFLIEDSSYMVSLWPHLKGSYLPSLLNAIKAANVSAAAEALWMTASEHVPFKHPPAPTTHRTPRWDDVPAIKFSSHGGNTISPANVARAIEALSATFGRGPATRHLVIVAAMNPSADALGPRGTLAWSTAVERLHQEEIRVHLITRSQSVIDRLTPLYWDLIGKGHAYQSFTDDNRFAFYLCDFRGATDKGKASATDNERVPNSGLRSMSSSASSIDKPSLVYQIQKINGMEKKRRSKTRRDQPAAHKPGEPYQKSHPHTRTSSSTSRSGPPDPSSRSPSRRKDASRGSKFETPPSYFDANLSKPPSDEYRPLYPSATSPSRSSSPSSPYHLSAGTSSSSPDLRNISPLRASLPMPSTFDHFQHMALGSQTSPDSLSPTSPGYHEFQGYNQDFPGEPRVQHAASQAIPVDGSHLGTQFGGIDVYGPDRSSWNEYGRQQGRIELSAYPRSLTSHPPELLAPRLAHRPEQVTATSSLPPTPHGLHTPPAGGSSGSYFYPDYEDRAGRTSTQNTYPLADHPSGMNSPTTSMPYYP